MEKGLTAFHSSLLILQIISEKEQYGYQIIKDLELRSEYMFAFKEGTLYPILHSLEEKGALESFEKQAESGKIRKYYRITKKGKLLLKEKKAEWEAYQLAINRVLEG